MMCRMEEKITEESSSLIQRSDHEQTSAASSTDPIPPIEDPASPPLPCDPAPPLLLDLPSTTASAIIFTAIAAAVGVDVVQGTEGARFSPVPPLPPQERSVHLMNRSTTAVCDGESPMPASFVSPILRSPDLLSHHHYDRHTDGADVDEGTDPVVDEVEVSMSAEVDPMEGCELNVANIESNSPEETLCDDSIHNVPIQDSLSSSESEEEAERKVNRRLSVSERVAVVERAITTSSSVMIPVPPPSAAVMHKRSGLGGKNGSFTNTANDVVITVENKVSDP